MTIPKDRNSLIGKALEAIKATGKTEFGTKEWLKILGSVSGTIEQRDYLASAFLERKFVDRSVKLTSKGIDRVTNG